jgi:membrane associated rhomboid family serine protease
MTAGIGALVAVAGSIVYFASDERYGIILILSGLVIAIMGLVQRRPAQVASRALGDLRPYPPVVPH